MPRSCTANPGERTKKKHGRRGPCFSKEGEGERTLAIAQADPAELFGKDRRVESTEKRFERRRLEHWPVPQDILTHDFPHDPGWFGARVRWNRWNGKMHGERFKKRTGVAEECAGIIPENYSQRHQARGLRRGRKFTVNGTSRLS